MCVSLCLTSGVEESECLYILLRRLLDAARTDLWKSGCRKLDPPAVVSSEGLILIARNYLSASPGEESTRLRLRSPHG